MHLVKVALPGNSKYAAPPNPVLGEVAEFPSKIESVAVKVVPPVKKTPAPPPPENVQFLTVHPSNVNGLPVPPAAYKHRDPGFVNVRFLAVKRPPVYTKTRPVFAVICDMETFVVPVASKIKLPEFPS